MRAANGHAEPYKVGYWNVGNEMYGHWQLGHMALDQYVIKHNLFADAMREVDPSIYIIAPGGFVDEMTTGQGIVENSASPLVQYGSDRDWAGGMFRHCWGKFDALATHAYPMRRRAGSGRQAPSSARAASHGRAANKMASAKAQVAKHRITPLGPPKTRNIAVTTSGNTMREP